MPKFCTNCGSGLVDGAKFCNKCGATVQATEPPPAAPSFTPPQAQASAYQPASSSPMYPAPAAGTGLQSNVAGALCYLLGVITGIIFLVIAPHNRDRFVRFHAFQAIFFSAAWIIISIVLITLQNMMPWPVAIMINLLFWVLRIGLLVTWLYLMYKAYSNERFKLPVIGDLAEKQAG